ncbi:CNOT7 isoform 6 [Pan troglodytes]|uniref:CCR4-NOT transcription complex subunit 7 n=12 Tax=Catarrhini TaxID=9526 RepID=E5RHV9_HUMAN|nr:CCR4-NOT transcription complex subunit 7 [Homo sapiens]PNI34851.1 CNOT7 isoform 5 [Pan troglodytes]PNJ76704.1 CNOT7 isoform 5 [Pongo abelii]KAI2548993.1 CCR4-NOT transcription complex subunit 7 [Homo sapiens]KAI4009635.1 CCR4-NOT transcription complex subunit 7 [Homo sapiens]
MPAATVDHSQRICEVWACNLDEEMKKIRQVIRKYNYVAMFFKKLGFSIGIL